MTTTTPPEYLFMCFNDNFNNDTKWRWKKIIILCGTCYSFSILNNNKKKKTTGKKKRNEKQNYAFRLDINQTIKKSFERNTILCIKKKPCTHGRYTTINVYSWRTKTKMENIILFHYYVINNRKKSSIVRMILCGSMYVNAPIKICRWMFECFFFIFIFFVHSTTDWGIAWWRLLFVCGLKMFLA